MTRPTEPLEVETAAELLKIRAFLRARGFKASVEEITEYLRDLEQAEQPDLFSGPLFDKPV